MPAALPRSDHALNPTPERLLQHYHLERSHQSLANELIVKRTGPTNDNGQVKRRTRLGGMLSYYRRAETEVTG